MSSFEILEESLGTEKYYLPGQSCIAVRKHLRSCERKLRMLCSRKSDAAAVCLELKVLSEIRLSAIYV